MKLFIYILPVKYMNINKSVNYENNKSPIDCIINKIIKNDINIIKWTIKKTEGNIEDINNLQSS